MMRVKNRARSTRYWLVAAALLLIPAGLGGPSSAPAGGTPCADSAIGPTSIRVCITGPGDGARVSGVVPISATLQVTGRDAIRGVAFFLDGTYILDDQEPDLPVRHQGLQAYGFELPSAGLSDGSKVLGAEALTRRGVVSDRATVEITLANGGVGAPVNTGTFSPPAIAQNPAQPLVVGAVGDGANGSEQEREVSDMVASWNPGLFLYLGDVYLEGTDAEFYNWYGHSGAGISPSDQLFSRFRAITAPTVGNHEYYGPEGDLPYANYWNMGAAARHYYSFDAGGWHFISLDSTPVGQYGQTTAGTHQYQWLASDLAASDRRGDRCTIVYFHHPMWHKTGQFVAGLAPFWSLFAAHGVEIVLNGHIHDYERWQPLNANGRPLSDGVVQIVVGSGGESLSATSRHNPEVRASWSLPGALRLRLYADRAEFAFSSTADPTRSLDSSASSEPITCHGPPVDTTPPSAAAVSSTSTTPGRVRLRWTPAIDRIGVSAYDIYRDGTRVATTDGMTTTLTDVGLRRGEHHVYRVVARDAAGNTSASEPLSVTLPGRP
ncbi:MAG: metallophosphoesterase [Actinomycetota bacterium]|nr:metallophosphoesterase [Actinomycetota bacterium]